MKVDLELNYAGLMEILNLYTRAELRLEGREPEGAFDLNIHYDDLHVYTGDMLQGVVDRAVETAYRAIEEAQ